MIGSDSSISGLKAVDVDKDTTIGDPIQRLAANSYPPLKEKR